MCHLLVRLPLPTSSCFSVRWIFLDHQVVSSRSLASWTGFLGTWSLCCIQSVMPSGRWSVRTGQSTWKLPSSWFGLLRWSRSSWRLASVVTWSVPCMSCLPAVLFLPPFWHGFVRMVVVPAGWYLRKQFYLQSYFQVSGWLSQSPPVLHIARVLRRNSFWVLLLPRLWAWIWVFQTPPPFLCTRRSHPAIKHACPILNTVIDLLLVCLI